MCKIDWSLIVQIFSAIGTLAVAVLAIWGNLIKSIFAPPKLRIIEYNSVGQLGYSGNPGVPALYFHLKVINQRRWAPALNCRVVLSEYYKLLPDGTWDRSEMIVEPIFKWSPSDHTRKWETVHSQHVFDFVKLTKGQNIEPCLNRSFNDFGGYVVRDKSIRYGIRVISDEFEQKKPQVFQVDWNGIWPQDSEGMVIIKEIK